MRLTSLKTRRWKNQSRSSRSNFSRSEMLCKANARRRTCKTFSSPTTLEWSKALIIYWTDAQTFSPSEPLSSVRSARRATWSFLSMATAATEWLTSGLNAATSSRSLCAWNVRSRRRWRVKEVSSRSTSRRWKIVPYVQGPWKLRKRPLPVIAKLKSLASVNHFTTCMSSSLETSRLRKMNWSTRSSEWAENWSRSCKRKSLLSSVTLKKSKRWTNECRKFNRSTFKWSTKNFWMPLLKEVQPTLSRRSRQCQFALGEATRWPESPTKKLRDQRWVASFVSLNKS